VKHVAYLKIGMKMPIASSHGLEATNRPYRKHYLFPGVKQLNKEEGVAGVPTQINHSCSLGKVHLLIPRKWDWRGLRFFSECQVSEHQISERHIAEF
jgi:hypothetical protein